MLLSRMCQRRECPPSAKTRKCLQMMPAEQIYGIPNCSSAFSLKQLLLAIQEVWLLVALTTPHSPNAALRVPSPSGSEYNAFGLKTVLILFSSSTFTIQSLTFCNPPASSLTAAFPEGQLKCLQFSNRPVSAAMQGLTEQSLLGSSIKSGLASSLENKVNKTDVYCIWMSVEADSLVKQFAGGHS